MNRQAIAFLTMFSLILMLSVYYVTLPADTTSVIATENGEDLSQGKQDTSQKEEGETEKEVNDAEKLQQEISSKNDEEVKKNSDIVSNTESSEAEKQKALETIDSLKSDKANVDDVKKALADAKYMAAVEIIDGTCKVSVFESEDTKENAKAIMKIINDKITNKYLLELTFK